VNGTSTEEITAYVAAVRAALAGLPEATRDELLEDLPEHLAEVAADDVGSLVDRLGPPSVYAAELLAGAGFVGGFPDPPPSHDKAAELRETLLRYAHTVDSRTGPLFGHARASEFLSLLRPAWWVLRGYLAAMVIAAVLDDSGQPIGLLPRIGGSEVIALLLLAAAVFGSIWIGRRSAGLAKGPRYALYAGGAVLVLVALGGFVSADSSTRGSMYSEVDYQNPYSHVGDVFVYDEQGRLVEGARLFDQDGQPIRLGNAYCPGPDEFSEYTPAPDDSKYPYCPQNAPFRMPGAPEAPIAPDASIAPEAPIAPDAEPTGPVPSESASAPAGKATAKPSPTPSR
jgi:hypothetical protein